MLFTPFAQDLIEGFVVKTSGDSVRGFIRERCEWSKIQNLEIASTENGSLTQIPITEVDNFYLKKYDNLFFIRKVDVDKKPIENEKLEDVPDQRIVSEVVALRMILKGELNLLRLREFKEAFFHPAKE